MILNFIKFQGEITHSSKYNLSIPKDITNANVLFFKFY